MVRSAQRVSNHGATLRPIRLIALATLLSSASAHAQPAQSPGPAIDPSIGRVDVTLDLPKDKPYVGEMILLRMRSFIRADIVLDRIQQPPLLNFSWQQLGRDKPIQAMVDGFSVAGVERDLAIFPTTSGRLIVEPFIRHVTVVNSSNKRIEADFASKPIYVDVQNYAAINPPDQWWMPAKAVTLTDAWSQVPDEIKPGTLSRRTITVEALGLTGDRLPPPPPMQAPGTIVFRGPVNRETILTEEGPIGRGTYVWDLRPVSPSPARLPAIHVAWFDTQTRRMRDRAIADLWIAYTGTLVHPSHERAQVTGVLSAGPIALGLAGFAWMAAMIGVAVTGRPVGRAERRRRRALNALRRRARFADEPGFSKALVDLARSDPPRWTMVSRSPLVAPRLAAFDRARFGRDGDRVTPALRPLSDDLRRLWLEAAPPATDSATALPPLDGDIAAPTARSVWLRGSR